MPLPQARSGGLQRWSCCPHARQLCNQWQRSFFQESRGVAHPVFHTLGSAACMQTAYKWQRKPRCIETKCLRPGEFTQHVAIKPPSQIFQSNSAITMPIRCNFPVKQSKRVWKLFDMHSWQMWYCIYVKSANRHYWRSKLCIHVVN